MSEFVFTIEHAYLTIGTISVVIGGTFTFLKWFWKKGESAGVHKDEIDDITKEVSDVKAYLERRVSALEEEVAQQVQQAKIVHSELIDQIKQVRIDNHQDHKELYATISAMQTDIAKIKGYLEAKNEK